MQADSIPKTIVQASQQMQSGLLTSTALVKYYLERIQKLNPILNAFITVLEQQSLETAAQLSKLARKNLNMLRNVNRVKTLVNDEGQMTNDSLSQLATKLDALTLVAD
ncbi:hypothetical protein LC605_02635 [Nostoc sp. CHAB 5836]|uniref:amidase family protein n=1 Tax=Nostoc sp. CHAB 5836 TaxID=2780404 RepID=UPI001E3AB13C|nr:amidase family protein [Nostoc sp. CHAB 5836]MCC5613988.1 hypothetical protein [Nostoc sp. CHAB 5836]